MPRNIFISFISLAILLGMMYSPAHSAENSGGKNMLYYETPKYEDPRKGYWWYQKEPEKPKEEKSKEQESKKTSPEKRLPSLKSYSKKDLLTMHPDDFQELLMDFQKKAIKENTEQSATEYYVMVDIARRRAVAFTNMSSLVIQKNPVFDLSQDFPTAVPGMAAVTKQQLNETYNTILQAKDDFGLLFFYSPTCPYCVEQEKILEYFQDKYKWFIKGINVTIDPAGAQMFNATRTPTLILVYKNSKDYLPVAYGVVALNEIEQKLSKGIKLLRGEITPEQFNTYNFQKGGGFDPTLPEYPTSIQFKDEDTQK